MGVVRPGWGRDCWRVGASVRKIFPHCMFNVFYLLWIFSLWVFLLFRGNRSDQVFVRLSEVKILIPKTGILQLLDLFFRIRAGYVNLVFMSF